MQWSDSGATVERRWSGSGDDATSPGRSAFRSSKCTTSTLSGCAAAASHQPRCHSQMLPDSTRPARKSGANCSHPPTKQKPGMLRVWCSIDTAASFGLRLTTTTLAPASAAAAGPPRHGTAPAGACVFHTRRPESSAGPCFPCTEPEQLVSSRSGAQPVGWGPEAGAGLGGWGLEAAYRPHRAERGAVEARRARRRRVPAVARAAQGATCGIPGAACTQEQRSGPGPRAESTGRIGRSRWWWRGRCGRPGGGGSGSAGGAKEAAAGAGRRGGGGAARARASRRGRQPSRATERRASDRNCEKAVEGSAGGERGAAGR